MYSINSGALPTAWVTNYVLLESLNWIHERQRQHIAVDLRSRLADSAGFELVQCAQKDFHRGGEPFDGHERLSFGDAITAAYMERTGIENLCSFNHNFDGIGSILGPETAEDPFN